VSEAAHTEAFVPWKLAATLVVVLVNGFFVAAEFALVKVRPSQLEALARRGHRRAQLALGMVRNLDLYLSACQLGITIASLTLGWLAEPAVAALLLRAGVAAGMDLGASPWLHPVSLALALALITLVHMTVGEQAPKVWSIQKARPVCLWVAYPLHLFAYAFRPTIRLINALSNHLVRLGGAAMPSEHQSGYDTEELLAILEAAARSGSLTPRQQAFGQNILALADLEVRHVMVPRTDVAYLSTRRSLQENLKTMRQAGHSRLPLADPDLGNVKGLIHARDVLAHLLDGRTPDLDLLLRDCPTVPDTLPLPRLILDLQEAQTHCAVVVDEHGTMVGLAFLEDALEEIVGPIHDEFDRQVPQIRHLSPGVVELAGSMALPEAAEHLGLELEDEANTIGGLVVARLGRLPEKGAQVRIGPYQVSVTSVSHHRVGRLRFRKTDAPADPTSD